MYLGLLGYVRHRGPEGSDFTSHVAKKSNRYAKDLILPTLCETSHGDRIEMYLLPKCSKYCSFEPVESIFCRPEQRLNEKLVPLMILIYHFRPYLP